MPKEYIEKWAVVNKLIDLENEFQQFQPFHGFEHAMYRKVCEVEKAIGKTEAVVDIRHGTWLLDGRCSRCLANPLTTHKNYCPNCGARMDGDTNAD